MRAVVMHTRGGPEVLRYEEFPDPVPAADEALIRVRAATVNHTDLFHREGRFFIQKELPHILGMDVAGEVLHDIGEWREGDRVVATFEALGRERNGAYAELTTVPLAQLHRIPDGLSFEAAASIGLAFTTAWIALRDAGAERAVIHAASSGVGTAALQILKSRGSHVTAMTHPSKAARLRELGADAVNEEVRDASLVIDLVGRNTLQRSIDMLGRYGRIVCIGALSGDLAEINVMDLIMKSATIRGSFDVIRPDELDAILRSFADGTFQPVIDSLMPLAEARRAHERIEAGEAFGKIVLVPST